MDYFMRR